MKLQNNFTTVEQSKRLLELGVPADSADCYVHGKSRVIVLSDAYNYTEWIKIKHGEERESNFVPCWSVGRLIEIYEVCTRSVFERNDLYTPLNDIYTSIESLILNHKFDFSKLED